MRLTLVQPPNGVFDHYDLSPPLGLLMLASAARLEGAEVTLVDMNLRGMQEPGWLDDFHDNALRWIESTSPDVVGFTSMAVESHVCIEMARRLKERDRRVVTVLGGPHFSAIARDALEIYPWIDFVIAGEGESALRALLRELQGKRGSTVAPNLVSRAAASVNLRRPDRPSDDLVRLAEPAYDLVSLPEYFRLNPLRLMSYEPGRGCIFRCSFCYSPAMWGQGETAKGAGRVAADMAELARLGTGYVFFVQDNLLNSKPVVQRLCSELVEAGNQLEWNCYGTLPQLTPDIVETLSRAGCREVFIGVDAVSTVSKKSFFKHFFKGWEPLKEKLSVCLSNGIVPTCAFMIDLPEGDCSATDAALGTALFAKNLGCGIRLNTLTVYNGTTSAEELRSTTKSYTNIKPRLLLDTPPILQDNPYARERPDLYPFHATFLPVPVYERFVEGMHIAYTLFTAFPKTLLQYVLSDGGSLWKLFSRVAERIGGLGAYKPHARRPIGRAVFLEEFPAMSLSRTTRAALDLEVAQLALQRAPESVTASAATRGKRGSYRVGSFDVVDLPATPARLSDARPIETEDVRPYLLLRRGGRVESTPIDEEARSLLARLDAARRGRTSLDLTSEKLEALVRIGVIEAPAAPDRNVVV